MASVVVRFPGGRLATFTCSFCAARASAYEVIGSRGMLRVEPAFGLAEDLRPIVTVDGKTRARVFPQRDEFAPQLIYFSDCILSDGDPEPYGQEGEVDVRIIEAIYKSSNTARAVVLPHLQKKPRPTIKTSDKPASGRQAPLVRAAGPSENR